MDQLSIFDFITEDKQLPTDIKLLSLFSGIGAFEKALDRLGINYELVNYCEIDKHASRSYSAIHNVSEDLNLWDVTKVDEKALPKDIDLLTYGFPCQDISLAGKQKGLFNEDGTKTRSGLFFDALRIIEETQPKVAIAENVKNLVGKKFSEQFKIVLDSLKSAGYNNYYQVLNAKDYGIPQNRERVFIISIRKDIDNGLFEFPKGFPLEKRLKDVLEDKVDEKYYLTNAAGDRLFRTSYEQGKYENRVTQEDGVVSTLCARDHKDPKCVQIAQIYPNSNNAQAGGGYVPMVTEPHRIGGLYDTETSKHQAGSIWDKDAISPTLDTMQGGNRQPFITVDEDSVKVRVATKKGYDEAVVGDSINLEQPNSKTRRGRVSKQVAQTLNTMPQQAVVEPMAYDEQNKYIRQDGCVGTLTTDGSSPKHNNRVLVWDGYNQRIRADQSCVGTLTQNCGADLKRNGQGIIEQRFGSVEKTGELINDIANGKYPPDTAFGKYLFQSSRFNDKPLEECSQTIKSTKVDCGVIHNLRIRKLTPKECFRLMGFDDADFHKAEKVNSNSQLYKQAGNSIVVDVLEHLLSKALKAI